MNDLSEIKEFLKNVSQTYGEVADEMKHNAEECKAYLEKKKTAHFMPILHIENVAYLQFCGYSINLYTNGTWSLERNA